MRNMSLSFAICLLFTASISGFGLSGCATTGAQQAANPSPLTHGQVQLTLKKNETTQYEVLNSFGPPNIATIDGDGNEVWSYQKHATVSKSESSNTYATIILLGGGSKSSGFEQSSRTMTLIIKFNAEKKVIDFKSMSTSF